MWHDLQIGSRNVEKYTLAKQLEHSIPNSRNISTPQVTITCTTVGKHLKGTGHAFKMENTFK